MNPVSTLSWFLKCGVAATLCLLVYAAIALMGPKAPPLPTSRDGALTILDRYVQEPVPDVLLVGSSLTARLKEEYFDTPNLEVIGLAGGSPITGLEVALARDHLPKTVLIEMNVLTRGEDPSLVHEFSGGGPSTWPRPIRAVVAFWEKWLHASPGRGRLKARAASLLQLPPSNFDNRVYVARALQQWDAESPEGPVRANVAKIQQLIEAMERRGTQVLLYELPYAEQLERSRWAKLAHAIVHAEFPNPDMWLDINFNRSELRWADGIHLDERSAVIVSQSIDRALSSFLRPT